VTARHKLLLASAGTGKTFQLTNHFVRLLLDGVPPERILATTFTRLAAGEILDRVLLNLLKASRDEAEARTLGGHIGLEDLDSATCLDQLRKLVRQLDRLQVRTLDAFFAHLVGLYALELDLPPDWTIVEEADDAELRSEVLARVLEESDQEDRVGLHRALKQGAAVRGVEATMLDVVRSGRDLTLEAEEDAWRQIEADGLLDEADLASLCSRIEGADLPLTKAGKENKKWRNAITSLLQRVEAGLWEKLLSTTLPLRSLEPDSIFEGQPIPEDLRPLLLQLSRHAAAEIATDLIERNRSAEDLLGRFDELYERRKAEVGAYRFEDLPRKLALHVHHDRAELLERKLDLWFRVDGRIDHLLLDEFQDTAPLQLRTLDPLASEICADVPEERSLFCVGDVKQSIYGWRGAEPRLLAQLHEHWPALDRDTISVSFRSSRVVLGTVGLAFVSVDENPVFEGDERSPERAAARRWKENFTPQDAHHQEMEGDAVLREMRKKPSESKMDCTVRTVVRRVADLRERAPDAEIGVLVRKRKLLGRLIRALGDAGIPASGQGGNPLTDSAAVLVFLSVLHLADHPEDHAAALHVAASPFGPLLGLSPDETRYASTVSRELRERMLAEGPEALALELGAIVDADTDTWSAWDRKRWRRLLEVIRAAPPTLRPAELARAIREKRVEEPSSSPVRVMTIHASKGLEFDAVLLPQLDEPLRPVQFPMLSSRPDPFERIQTLSLGPRKAVYPFHAGLRALQEEERGRSVEESLSLLYVAMTRAKHHLEMLVFGEPEEDESTAEESSPRQGSTASSPSLMFADLLRSELVSPGEDDPEVLWRHEEGSEAWIGQLDGEVQQEIAPIAPPPTSLTFAERRPGARHLSSRRPSAGGAASVADLLRGPSSDATRRGSLVHAWLEELEWLEEFELDHALLTKHRDVESDAAVRAEAAEMLRGALEAPQVREALSRGDRAGVLEVLREEEFSMIISEDGVETMLNGSIDRLVLEKEGEVVVRAEVIDYKTDRAEGDAQLAERAEHHRAQLETYRSAVAKRYVLDDEQISMKLVFLAPGRVVDLDA
jgi:ATP-dependent exoDNAse (exonuclease V) beta subunit